MPTVSEEPVIAKHGAVVGDYRLQRRLGSGGAGEVWLGWHVHTDRPAAIKLLTHASRGRGAGRRSFDREWRAIARLSHPNVVHLYDAGPNHLAMAYVDGPNLAHRLRSPMEPAQALFIALQIASALSHSHEHGVVHRDVKPGNVMLDARGRAYLADFGLAILTEESGDGVPRGGTPGYMAPEQERERLVGPAADQYGLARTLLDMLTGGRAPADWRDALESLSPGLRAPLADVMGRALADRPEQRWPSVAAFAERIAETNLAGQPAPDRLAGARRSSKPFAWCASAVGTEQVSPDIACAHYSLSGLVAAGAVSRAGLERFTQKTGYGDVGWTAYACTRRLGPLTEPTVMSRASDLVLMLHGTANTRSVWRDVAIATCRDNAEAIVLVPDVFGFGESPFADARPAERFLASSALVTMVEAWLDLLELSDFPTVLVGHSAAAAELMSVTDDRLGEHVSRVALTPVFPSESRSLRIQLRLGSLLLRLFGRVEFLKKALGWLLVAHGPATAAFSAEDRAAMQKATLQVPWYVSSRLTAQLAKARPAEGDRLERCAIIVGKDDPLAPEKDVLEVLARLGVPDRNVHKMASGGHMPHLTEDAHPGWRMRNVDDIVRALESMLLSSREGASVASSTDSDGVVGTELTTGEVLDTRA